MLAAGHTHRRQAALERRSCETRDGEGKEGVRRRAELSMSSNTPNMAEVGRAFRGLRRIPVRVRAANSVDTFDRPTRQQHSPQGRGIEHAVLYAIVSWAPMKTLLCMCVRGRACKGTRLVRDNTFRAKTKRPPEWGRDTRPNPKPYSCR